MIWAVANGRWPAEGMDIDHKDSDTQNNAISNLEEVLEAENIRRGRVRRKKKAEIERSKELSLFDLRSRGKEGDVKAQFELGKLYHLGTAVRKNHFEASYWYRLAAEQGHKEAKKNLEKLFF
jgi:TPR repeat protein